MTQDPTVIRIPLGHDLIYEEYFEVGLIIIKNSYGLEYCTIDEQPWTGRHGDTGSTARLLIHIKRTLFQGGKTYATEPHYEDQLNLVRAKLIQLIFLRGYDAFKDYCKQTLQDRYDQH